MHLAYLHGIGLTTAKRNCSNEPILTLRIRTDELTTEQTVALRQTVLEE